MVALLAVGLVLVALALVPGLRKLPLVLVLVGIGSAGVASMLTSSTYLVVVGGVLPILLLLVAWEITDTFNLVAEQRRLEARRRKLELRELQRQRTADDRERAARERRRRRAA